MNKKILLKICKIHSPFKLMEYSPTRLDESKHVFQTEKFIGKKKQPTRRWTIEMSKKTEPSVNFEGPWNGPNFDVKVVPSESLLADNVIHLHKLQHLLVCVSHSLNVRYPMWTKEKSFLVEFRHTVFEWGWYNN